MPGSDDDVPFGYEDAHRGDGGWFPPPTAPRAVTGGIRGRHGTHAWWSRRWLAPIEALDGGRRLAVGRSYAREGQVTALDVGLGAITATVQGTRRAPYEVRVAVAQVGQLDWVRMAALLGARAATRAQLLAGTMPDDIEATFARLDLPLFPRLEDDLELACTCDDWTQPCAHVVAACALAGEAFDHDPFGVLRLRGIERDVLLTLLRGTPEPSDGEDEGAPGAAGANTASAPVDAVDPRAFWHGPAGPDAPPSDAAPLATDPPPVDAPLLRILGPFPLWRGSADLDRTLREAYAAAARGDALDLALGTPTEQS